MSLYTNTVIKLHDDIDTDIIIPTQYMTLKTVEAMSRFAFYPLRPEIPSLVKKGNILICGKNFGCGSSREQAPEILKCLGIAFIFAKSFARIFYRNAINNGLMAIENSEVYDAVNEGDTISVDLENNKIIAFGKDIHFGRIPGLLLDMVAGGGLVNYYKKINTSKGI